MAGELPPGVSETGTVTFADPRKAPIQTASGEAPVDDPAAWARAGARVPSGGATPFEASNPNAIPEDPVAKRAALVKQKAAELAIFGYSPEQAAQKAEAAIPGSAPPGSASAAPPGLVFQGAGSAQPAVIPPQYHPAYEQAVVNPKRQDAKIAAIGDVAEAVEGEKTAEDQVAFNRGLAAEMRAEGQRGVAKKFDEAASDVEKRSASNKVAQDDFLDRMEQFSTELANDKIGVKQSVPQRVTWGLARVFGALQQGLQHLPSNQVADGIDKEIAREIENQKANHAIKRGRMEDLKTLYGYAREQTKDQDEAHRLAHGYALEAAKAEANALAEAAGTPLAIAEAKKIQAALTEKQALLGERAVDAGIAMNKWVPAGLTGGSAHVDSKMVFYDPITSTRYAARDEASRKKLAESGAATLEMKAAADDYSRKLSQLSPFDKAQAKLGIYTPAMSAAMTAYQHAQSIPRHAQNDGVWKKSEAEMLAGSLHPPDQFFGDPIAQLGQLKKQVDDVHKSNMEVEDAVPVVAAPQPFGTAPKNIPTGQSNVPMPSVGTAGMKAFGFVPPPRAKGGKTSGGEPYLVGEKGPELVLPDRDGWVMTAQQTAALKGAPPTDQQIEARPELAALAPDHQRALGGMMGGMGGMSQPGASNGMVMRGGGMDVMGSLAATNAIDTQYLNHAGSSPVGQAAFRRADGGPVAPMTGINGQTVAVPATIPTVPPPVYPPAAPPGPQQYGAIGYAPAPSTWGGAQPDLVAQQDAAEKADLANQIQASQNYQYGQGATKTVVDSSGQPHTMSIDDANTAKLQGIDKARALGLYRNVPQTADEKAEERRLRVNAGQKVEEEKEVKKADEAKKPSTAHKAFDIFSKVLGGGGAGGGEGAVPAGGNRPLVGGAAPAGATSMMTAGAFAPVPTREEGGPLDPDNIADALGHLLPDDVKGGPPQAPSGARSASTAGAKMDSPVRGKAPTAVEKFAAKAGVQKREDGGPIGPDGKPYSPEDEKGAVRRFFAQNLARKSAQTVGATMDPHVRGKVVQTREEGGILEHSGVGPALRALGGAAERVGITFGAHKPAEASHGPFARGGSDPSRPDIVSTPTVRHPGGGGDPSRPPPSTKPAPPPDGGGSDPSRPRLAARADGGPMTLARAYKKRG